MNILDHERTKEVPEITKQKKMKLSHHQNKERRSNQ